MKDRIKLLTGILTAFFCLSSGTISQKDELIDFRNPDTLKKHKPILIAHRGGVVTPQTPECSIASIRLAKKQNYAMVELDIRKSKDDVPIVFHDRNMKEACGLDKSVKDLEVEEIVNTVYLNTDQKICTLDEALNVCRELKLGVMLDVKVQNDEKLLLKIVQFIKKHGLENSCITINGAPELRKVLEGVALLTVTGEEFNKVQQGLSCDLNNKFWFGLPEKLPSDMVRKLKNSGAYVIQAINTFRYPDNNYYELAQKDIQRLNDAGVDGYQIDSVYGTLF